VRATIDSKFKDGRPQKAVPAIHFVQALPAEDDSTNF
jgi:hypothetical protein